jgi:hypothetical protein
MTKYSERIMSADLQKLLNKIKNFGPCYLASREATPWFFLEFDQVNERSHPLSAIAGITDWSNGEEKYLPMRNLKANIRAYGRLLRYGYICEAGSVATDIMDPSVRADHTDHVRVEALERGGPLFCSRAAIIRDPSGERSLANWEGVTPMFSLLGDVFDETGRFD